MISGLKELIGQYKVSVGFGSQLVVVGVLMVGLVVSRWCCPWKTRQGSTRVVLSFWCYGVQCCGGNIV
jgi:hypothetical protein